MDEARQGLTECGMVQHAVRLLRRWRRRGSESAASRLARCSSSSVKVLRIPPDVPAGCVAVCVGASARRFVMQAAHLNHPAFRDLLVQAAEEYGFDRPGPLSIPCDESLFVETLRSLRCSCGPCVQHTRSCSPRPPLCCADDVRRPLLRAPFFVELGR